MEDGDWEGAYPSRGRILFHVVCKLSYQAKIDGAHGVDSWVWGPHVRKDLSHGADVLTHTSFVDGLVVGCKGSCEDLVSNNL